MPESATIPRATHEALGPPRDPAMHRWRGGRAVECGGLENRCARKSTGGSNPPLSVWFPARNHEVAPSKVWGDPEPARARASARQSLWTVKQRAVRAEPDGEARTAACEARCANPPLSASESQERRWRPAPMAGFSRPACSSRPFSSLLLDSTTQCEPCGAST